MIIQAELKCKQTGCEADPCAVDKVIELPSQRFQQFSHALLADYTRALLSSIPEPDISMRNKKISVIKGEVVSPINPKPGCRFAPRCENCMEICTQCSPELKEVAPGHLVACHKYA